MLDVGQKSSELVLFENGSPRAVRVLPFGREDFSASGTALDSLVQSLNGATSGGTLVITGDPDLPLDFPSQLRSRLPGSTPCLRPETMAGAGRSATTLGLKKSAENDEAMLLVLRIGTAEPSASPSWSSPAARKLLLTVAALVAGLLLLPFAEALVLKPLLTRKLAALKSDRNRLPMIDRELDFLEYLQSKLQPPALDALYIFAKSAPPGARIDFFQHRSARANCRPRLHAEWRPGG